MVTQKIEIANAGMVIVHPYLFALFSDVGLMTGKAFKDEQCKSTAVALLHYLANGKDCAPGEELALYNLLCGLSTGQEHAKITKISKGDKDRCDSLLAMMISHWPIMEKAFIEDFRSAFLNRKGILTHTGAHWTLKIEHSPYDMIMDSLPWDISTITTAWMDQTLQVEWRSLVRV